jgi:predicted AAA+ superfamily ATPase
MAEAAGGAALPPGVEAFLRDTNPWWLGKPGPRLPAFQRPILGELLWRLESGLTPCVALRGPRQVGKTTLQGHLIEHLLQIERARPTRILRVQFDDLPPLKDDGGLVLRIARWFQRAVLDATFNEAARAGEGAYLLLDEVQNLKAWAPQIKSLVDHHDVRVMVTGSSSLRIEAGQDSLAGRIRNVTLGPLSVREIAGLRFGAHSEPPLGRNQLDSLTQREFCEGLVGRGRDEADLRRQAFEAFSQRGGYPHAQAHPDVPWPDLADYLDDTVIRRAIGHDLRTGPRGQRRDQRLLEEVFRLACRYAGQAPGPAAFVSDIRYALAAEVGWQRILNYLAFLDSAMLVRMVPPLELRLKRRRGPSRLCLCDHTLRASWLQEVVPLAPAALAREPQLADIAGHLAESTVGYFLSTIPGLDVAHFPERGIEPKVDFVLTIGTKRIPLEVKYRNRIDEFEDTRGLRSFLEKTVYNAPFGILVTMHDDVPVTDPRIVSIPLSTLLWMR